VHDRVDAVERCGVEAAIGSSRVPSQLPGAGGPTHQSEHVETVAGELLAQSPADEP
jgi:hypothetical protein